MNFNYYILNPDKTIRGTNDIYEWGFWKENTKDWIIQKDKVGDYEVSTVFLGLDHSFSPYPHNPVLFETMIFPDCEYCRRCETYDQAIQQHNEAVIFLNTTCGLK